MLIEEMVVPRRVRWRSRSRKLLRSQENSIRVDRASIRRELPLRTSLWGAVVGAVVGAAYGAA